MDLSAIIAGEIRRHGPIPFSRYMELCLYHPELGYYSRAREQFGKAGDFYTSSDVHAVFGRLLARQFDEMWRAMDSPPRIHLIELGPGRGLFAQDVLDWSQKKFPDFLDALRYTLIESSPGLRARLEERFAGRGAVSVVASLDELPHDLENVIIFGNEFFDAFPVDVIAREAEASSFANYQCAEADEPRSLAQADLRCGVTELRIGLDGNRFVEVFVPPSPANLDYLNRYGVHPEEGERTETALAAKAYIERIAGLVRRGFGVFIDYGYTREELLAGRQKSTVRAFRRHSISDTPYEAPGEQDITASVNFTALRETALAAGFDHACILTQAQFLMGIGETNHFSDVFEDALLPQEHTKVALQLKHLVTPAGMGELFQVLVLRRNIDKEKAAKLSGLTFARHG
jgi:SAM-dependent MidA family methyltransferase